MMPRYNIALLPEDDEILQQFITFSRRHFQGSANGYLLGVEALPHVTLCQFRAAGRLVAENAYLSFHPKRRMEVFLGGFAYRHGTQGNAGKVMANFSLEREPRLIELQRLCFEHLSRRHLDILTPVDTYNPHLTVASLPDAASSRVASELAIQQPMLFRPVLGQSTENGVLFKVLRND